MLRPMLLMTGMIKVSLCYSSHTFTPHSDENLSLRADAAAKEAQDTYTSQSRAEVLRQLAEAKTQCDDARRTTRRLAQAARRSRSQAHQCLDRVAGAIQELVASYQSSSNHQDGGGSPGSLQSPSMSPPAGSTSGGAGGKSPDEGQRRALLPNDLAGVSQALWPAIRSPSPVAARRAGATATATPGRGSPGGASLSAEDLAAATAEAEYSDLELRERSHQLVVGLRRLDQVESQKPCRCVGSSFTIAEAH